jgi:putative inorganic carbon (HCO3(-)) transporter
MKDKNKNQAEAVKSKVSVFLGYAIEGMWLFLLVAMPLFYYRSHQSFNMPKMQLMCVVVSLMLVLWIIKGLEQKKFDLRWNSFTILCGAYLIALILSTIFSYYPTISWWGSYIRFEGLSMYLFFIASFFLIFWSLKDLAQVKRIVGFAAIATLPVSVYGFFQYFGHDFLEFTGTKSGFTNIISTLGNQLYLSDYLILTIPLVVSLVFISKKAYFKIFWFCVGLLDIWALFLTARRSGFVALVAIAVFGLLLIAWRWRKSAAVISLLVIMAFGVLVAINFEKIANTEFVQNQSHLKRIFSVVDLEDSSIKQRLLVWEIAWDMIKKRPFIGYGPETFLYAFDANYPPYFTEMPEVYFDRAHNFTLDTAYRVGFIGLAALFGLLGLALYVSIKTYVKNKDFRESYLGWGIALSISGFFVHNQFIFENGATRYILFTLIAAVGALPGLIKKAKMPADIKENGQKSGQPLKFWSVSEFKIIYYALLFIVGVYAVKFHIFPIIGDFYYNNGLSYTKFEDKKKREQNFAKAIYYIRDVRSATYYQKMGSDYFIYAQNVTKDHRDNAFEKSVEWYNRAIEKDPRRFLPRAELGQVYIIWSSYLTNESEKTEKMEKGNELFSQAVEISPGRQMNYWDWGRALIRIGEQEAGIEKYLIAVKLDPDIGRSYFELAKAYRDIDQSEMAEENFAKARQLGYRRGSEKDPL